MKSSLLIQAGLIGLTFGFGACHTGDVNPLEAQSKFQAYEENTFFADGRSMRPLVDGVVPRERILVNNAPEITKELVQIGKEKFEQTCSVCHGMDGTGASEVSRKMQLRKSPSLHEDRIRALSSADIYKAVTQGFGYMPRYTTQLNDQERWAVVAYVRALQLSRNMPVAELPDDLKQQLEKVK